MTDIQHYSPPTGATPNAHPMHDAGKAAWNIKPKTVLIMIGISMGLGLCAYQIATDQVVAVMAVFWGLTALAILVYAVHSAIGRPRPDPGRHRHQLAH
jgi:hypothetical protein